LSKKPPKSSPPGTPPPGQLPPNASVHKPSPELNPLKETVIPLPKLITPRRVSRSFHDFIEPGHVSIRPADFTMPQNIPKVIARSRVEQVVVEDLRPISREEDERVAVSVLTLMRPNFLEQCLDSILLNTTPLKIVVTNQADYSNENMRVLNKWKDKPFVHYRVNDPRKWPGPSRAQVFELLAEAGYEYVITLDDDCKLLPSAIDELVKAADEHPEFHAISGYLITPGRGDERKYMLGGIKVYHKDINKWIYRNFVWTSGVHETEYICNGFRLIRLDPLVLPDKEFTMGLTDFDWAANARSQGLRLAVCGEAGAYHKFLFVDGEKTALVNPPTYKVIRRNRSEIEKMKKRFAAKWGYRI